MHLVRLSCQLWAPGRRSGANGTSGSLEHQRGEHLRPEPGEQLRHGPEVDGGGSCRLYRRPVADGPLAGRGPHRPETARGLHGSAPWFIGYHALSCLDYDLTGDFEPWLPPQPFDDNTYAFPNRVFTPGELLGYVDWCRGRVRDTLDALTEESAARPLPSTHRYHGTAFGVIVGNVPIHVIEHAAQIRQFLAASGVKVRSMPGDRGYTNGA